MAYVANVSLSGPMKYKDVPGSIGVLEAPDQFMPIGMAHCLTWDRDGRAVWKLTIGGQETPGRWVIINRRFQQAQ